MSDRIKCTVQGGRLYVPKEDGDGRRPITSEDAECFAAWKGSKDNPSLLDGEYIVMPGPTKAGWIMVPAETAG